MAYITGTGTLTAGELECENAGLAFRSKDVTGTGDLEAGEFGENEGTGLSYVDGEILGYITNLKAEEAVMVGSGKADNLVGIPRATCFPIKANFHVCTTKIEARFRL